MQTEPYTYKGIKIGIKVVHPKTQWAAATNHYVNLETLEEYAPETLSPVGRGHMYELRQKASPKRHFAISNKYRAADAESISLFTKAGAMPANLLLAPYFPANVHPASYVGQDVVIPGCDTTYFLALATKAGWDVTGIGWTETLEAAADATWKVAMDNETQLPPDLDFKWALQQIQSVLSNPEDPLLIEEPKRAALLQMYAVGIEQRLLAGKEVPSAEAAQLIYDAMRSVCAYKKFITLKDGRVSVTLSSGTLEITQKDITFISSSGVAAVKSTGKKVSRFDKVVRKKLE
jgi:hypothetical protein